VRVTFDADLDPVGREAFLNRHAFTLLSTSAWRAKISVRIVEAPWFDRWQAPAPHEIVAWSNLSRAAHARATALERSAPAHLRPSRLKHGLDPRTSFALLLEGDVLGWLITHAIEPKVIAYSALYVRQSDRGSALGYALVAEAVRRQARFAGLDSYGVLTTSTGNAVIGHLLEEKLRPYLVARRLLRAAERHLT
jgi:hypothetical protein